MDQIKDLDYLFQSYNYSVATNSNSKVRIYTLAYGMYHAAEIIVLDDNSDVLPLKNSYSELGYATEIRYFTSLATIEEYLFEGFFIKTPLGGDIRNKYKQFTKKQIKNLPENSSYAYIESSYDLLLQDQDHNIIESRTYDGINDISLITKISDIISQTTDAQFIIIEAPAGFGKTCTAYELLNSFDNDSLSKNLPFFTELSRNREARIFKHILLSEIDEQFPSGIKKNTVLEQIYKGRIPLIIDGFDELITKDSNKEDVESMLTTIVDLLRNNAKIIITSRKTAIFNSEEFLKTIYDCSNSFQLARIEIKEPKLENWLEPRRLDLISKNEFPLAKIANPVLLSYLRNIPYEHLDDMTTENNGTLIDKYFDFLLLREVDRQNLKLNKEQQLLIMASLNAFFCEFNVTAEDKNTIKEIIKDFNYPLLTESLSKYPAENKPTIDELCETLSNHVLLDRKTNNEIGFINDFILGFFVGDNILNEKLATKDQQLEEVVPQDFAYKALEAFRVTSDVSQFLLWDMFSRKSCNFEKQFYFELDYTLQKSILKQFDGLYLFDRKVESINFKDGASFHNCVFSGVLFYSCNFDLSIYNNTSFQNCQFFDCTATNTEKLLKFTDFAIYACSADNGFLTELSEALTNDLIVQETTAGEEDILKRFFHVDNTRPRPRKLSQVKKMFPELSEREFSRIIDSLKTKEFLHFKDDVAFITREAVNHLRHI